MTENHNTNMILQKEKEWRDLLLSELEKAKNERNKTETYLKDIREKFLQLEFDFKHNLRLLEDRDKELHDMEKENFRLRESVFENEEKISTLCVETDKLKMDLRTVDEVKETLKEKLYNMTNKVFNDIQAVRNEKIKEIERIKDENAEKVKKLERKIIQMEAEAQENQSLLMANIEETLRSREGELKRKTEEVHSELLGYELKYRLASKELDLARISKADILRNLSEKEDIIRSLEIKLSENELASKSELSIEKMKMETEALHAREKEINLIKEIDKLSKKLDEKNNALRNKIDLAKRLEGEIKSILDNGKQLQLEKEQLNENLQLEKEKFQNKLKELENAIVYEREKLTQKDLEINRIISKMTDENIKKDGELRNVRLEMDNLVQNLRKKQEELLELRNELEYAVGKDMELSKMKEHDREIWESKLERVKIEEMSKVESMIKAVTKARDESLAEVKELRSKLEDRKLVRLCANCSKESTRNSTEFDGENYNGIINELTQQNQQLKNIISQMTEEATKQLNCKPKEVVTTNKHIASLAERNRQLQQEKIELLATSRKLQARLEAVESDNNDIKKKIRERETEISQVKFELDSLHRHTGMDVRTMRRTLGELETELSVSRKEAEEYYKGNLELGRIVEDLQSELTLLKSEQIEKLPTLNFGAQEMLIEQLKKEIGELRGKLIPSNTMYNGFDHEFRKNDEKEIMSLRAKLKAAANHIKNLANEKQVLIQISNRLRMELKEAGIQIPSCGKSGKNKSEYVVDSDGNKDIKRTINDLEDKLFKLEHLQKNLRCNYSDKNDINGIQRSKSPKDMISSVGRESVDEVFKLLDDSDSLVQSSIMENERRLFPSKSSYHVERPENSLLWSKSVKLNSPKTRKKRNVVTNR